MYIYIYAIPIICKSIAPQVAHPKSRRPELFMHRYVTVHVTRSTIIADWSNRFYFRHTTLG